MHGAMWCVSVARLFLLNAQPAGAGGALAPARCGGAVKVYSDWEGAPRRAVVWCGGLGVGSQSRTLTAGEQRAGGVGEVAGSWSWG
jgi:hypothetical protein